MPILGVTPEIHDGDWADHIDDPAKLGHGLIEQVGNLPAGMESGAPAFQILARLDDGTQVVIETSWTVMRGALRAIDARWRNEP